MAKTWEQIVMESGKVPPSQTKKDKQEMLEELGMTWAEFKKTEEWKKMAKKAAEARFNSPGVILKK